VTDAAAGDNEPFGAPGIAPTWSSSAKDLVTRALGPSRLWATLGHGIVNEVYWPATGQPQVRDLGFIVAGTDFWVEVKRVNNYRLTTPEPYIPLPKVIHEGERYRLTLEVLPDPMRDVLLIYYRLEGEGLSLYPLLAPHLGTSGWNNTAWVADGVFAQSDGRSLCLLNDSGFLRASAGYVGYSDGWQDFAHNAAMTYTFARAEAGNVALMAEIGASEGVLALGLAQTPEGARTLAASSLSAGYRSIRERFVAGWTEWDRRLELPAPTPDLGSEAHLSATVLRVHEDCTYPGALVASLSIPWGNTHNDPGGYHLVWTRDAVEAAFGLLACGQEEDARRVLAYLAATQGSDGAWCQNFFPDGRPYWTGVQLDEAAFPILLAAKLRELGLPESEETARMVRRATAFVVQNGPVSPQDRWEENPGASPFTLAVEVAALVAAVPYLDPTDAAYALELADCWNERIEDWTYVQNTEFTQRFQVDGYYVRIGPPAAEGGLRGCIDVRNRRGDVVPAEALVGLEFIYLARLGLRSPDDRRILDSLKVADALLRTDTPCGPVYHRYNGDGYGEHQDGSPYDGTGVGRGWPLLVGERGHLALLRGEDTLPYLEAMACMTGRCGLLPEQVWDSDPVPRFGLTPGKPSGSVMPLVWAHAEFLKLLVAQEHRRPIELLDAVWQRYEGKRPAATTWYWQSEAPFDMLPADRSMVVADSQPFVLHMGRDGWHEVHDRASQPLGLGMHGVRLDRADLTPGGRLRFTRFYPRLSRWEGEDHAIELRAQPPPAERDLAPARRHRERRNRRSG
jgi:glucoamylase